MANLPDGWRREGDAIVTDYELKNFSEALGLVNRIGALAEDANHHPDLLLHGWNKLRVTLSTHSEGGVTEKDHELAVRIARL